MSQSQAFDPTIGQWPEVSTLRPLKTTGEEIRLLRPDSYGGDGGLEFTMHHIELESAKFAALSYAWGAPVPKSNLKSITIDGEEVQIRPTLYSFLERARAHGINTYLWIDALCISQCDVEERNRQVAMMGKIFTNAAQVHVWLGSGDDDTNYAFEHIESSKVQTPYDRRLHILCINRVFELSYWRRRWIIQEFGLAQDLHILCGSHKISWSELFKKINVDAFVHDSYSKQNFVNFSEIRSLVREQKLDLLQLMLRFRTSECVDKRDRALALRSIARDGASLTPNYNESITDLFFRQLSRQTVENVLPRIEGYRWPHQAALQLSDCLALERSDIVSSLKDKSDDRLFAVFEYVGTVTSVIEVDHSGTASLSFKDVQVSGLARPSADYFSSWPYIWYWEWTTSVQGTSPPFRYPPQYEKRESDLIMPMQSPGCDDVRSGDTVYSLQTSEDSRTDLFIAFRPDVRISKISGLLYNGDVTSFDSRSECLRFLKKASQVLRAAVTRCFRNSSAEGLTKSVFCHLERAAMILLWMFDARNDAEVLQCDFSCDDERRDDGIDLRCKCWSETDMNLGSEQTDSMRLTPGLSILPAVDDGFSAGYLWSQFSRPSLFSPPEESKQKYEERDRAAKLRLEFRLFGRSRMIQAAADNLTLWVEDFLQQSELDVDSCDRDDRTALSWAASYGNLQAVKLLLESGRANVNRQDRMGRSPVTWAIYCNQPKVVEFLIGYDQVDWNPKTTDPPLQSAIQVKNMRIVKMLLDSKKVQPDEKSGGKLTPLERAMEQNDAAVVECLLRTEQVNYNRLSPWGRTPVMEAVIERRVTILRLLLTCKDVDVSTRNERGWDIWHWASESGNEVIRDILIDGYMAHKHLPEAEDLQKWRSIPPPESVYSSNVVLE